MPDPVNIMVSLLESFTHINLQLVKKMQLKLWRHMIMNGQMKKYKESLAKTSGPILLSQITQKMDLRGLMKYAKEKGVKVEQLSKEEKFAFLK